VCWNKVYSKPQFSSITLKPSSFNLKQFSKIANNLRNECFRFSKSTFNKISNKNKKTGYKAQNNENKIVQEGLRFLLEIAFKPLFSKFSPNLNQSCHDVLLNVKRTFNHSDWYLTTSNLPTSFHYVNHQKFIQFIEKRIQDPLFIQLIQLYIKQKSNKIPISFTTQVKAGFTGEEIDSLLWNVYLIQFDRFIKFSIIRFNKAQYIRRGNTFLVGLKGSKKNCTQIRSSIFYFFQEYFHIISGIPSIQIYHATQKKTFFLGYKIQRVLVKKRFFIQKTNCIGKNSIQVESKLVLTAPVSKIVEQLYEVKFVKKQGKPSICGRLIHLSLPSLVNYYKEVEKGILDYYFIASNFTRIACRVHYLLKFSCALTLANKLNLKTLKQVFRTFGPSLEIKESNQKQTSYPMENYKNFKKVSKARFLTPLNIEELTHKLDQKFSS